MQCLVITCSINASSFLMGHFLSKYNQNAFNCTTTHDLTVIRILLHCSWFLVGLAQGTVKKLTNRESSIKSTVFIRSF